MYLTFFNKVILKLPFYSESLHRHFGLCRYKTKFPLKKGFGFGFRFLNNTHQEKAEKMIKSCAGLALGAFLVSRLGQVFYD